MLPADTHLDISSLLAIPLVHSCIYRPENAFSPGPVRYADPFVSSTFRFQS